MPWRRIEDEWWELLFERRLIPPLSREEALMDFRFLFYSHQLQNQSNAWLAKRWGWFSKTGKPSTKKVRLLISSEEWVDEDGGREKGARRARAGREKGQPETGEARKSRKPGREKGASRARAGREKGHARVVETLDPETLDPEKKNTPLPPEWVLTCLAHIKGEVDPNRCKTDSKQLQGFRRNTGLEVPDFVAATALVARAFRHCPHRLFARDVRAEGWSGGTDRSRSVGTFCVAKRWGDRLAEAERWKDAGFPMGSTLVPDNGGGSASERETGFLNKLIEIHNEESTR